MLVGYVSDERYVALADVLLEFESRAGRSKPARAPAARSMPTSRRATIASRLQKPGFGAKRAQVTITPISRTVSPAVRRTVGLCLAQVGVRRASRPSFASTRSSRTSSTCGATAAKGARRQDRLVRRARTAGHDADHARRRLHANRRRVEQGRLQQPAARAVRRRRRRSGLYYFHARTDSGRFFAFPWIVAPASAHGADRGAGLEHHLERVQQLRRAQQLHPCRPAAADADGQRPPRNCARYNDPAFGTWNAEEYAPLSFDRPEPINHVPEHDRDHRPDRRPGGLPRGAGRMAAAGLDGARRIRLRPLCRDATARRRARSGRLSRAGDQHASGVLVARDVPGGESVGCSSAAGG